jgi:hypothetical protein
MTAAVFAVFAGNYQRQTIPPPQKYSISGGMVKQRTAGQRPMAGCLARSLVKMKGSRVARRVR